MVQTGIRTVSWTDKILIVGIWSIQEISSCFGAVSEPFLVVSVSPVTPPAPASPLAQAAYCHPSGVVSGLGTRGRHAKTVWGPNTRPARRKTGFPEPKIVKIQGSELAGNATGPDHVPAFPHRQTGLEASSRCPVVRKK